MSTTTECNVVERKTGKGPSRALRLEKKIPAVIYGPKLENQNCYVEELFVLRHSGAKHESSIFQTKSETSKLNSLKVMLKKIQTHPATNRPVHVDLYALDMAAKITVNVTVEYVGEPIGVKENGGVLQTILREVEIECNATEIPEFIKVDISSLDVGSSLHVSDVNFPAGVTPTTAGERTMATVNLPKEEKAAEPATAADGEAAPAAGDAAPTEEKK